MTVLPFLRNARITHFDSFEHMEQSLLASSCLFPMAGVPVYVEGYGYCIDGGLSDLQLLQGAQPLDSVTDPILVTGVTYIAQYRRL